MTKHYFFIINPVYRIKANSLEKEIISFFKSREDKYQIVFSKNLNNLSQLAKEAVQLKVDVVIACGGDGTVNKVGQILIGKKIKFGIVPIGSGNGLANHFQIPKNYYRALKVIVKGVTKKMDVGRVDNRYFFSNIGFGIEAEFIRNYNFLNIHGLMGYFLSFFKSIFSFKSGVLEIVSENKKIMIIADVLMILNANEQGYGISLSRSPKIDDGSFEVLIIDKTNPIYFIYLTLLVLLGFSIKKKKKVRCLFMKDFKITSKKHYINMQIDGEFDFIMKNNIHIRVIPKGIDVLC